MEVLKREFIYLWYYTTILLEQIFPYWVLGMVTGSAVSVFGKEKIHSLFGKMQGKGWGVFGIVPACILGLPHPCACTEQYRSRHPLPGKGCGRTGLQPL